MDGHHLRERLTGQGCRDETPGCQPRALQTVDRGRDRGRDRGPVQRDTPRKGPGQPSTVNRHGQRKPCGNGACSRHCHCPCKTGNGFRIRGRIRYRIRFSDSPASRSLTLRCFAVPCLALVDGCGPDERLTVPANRHIRRTRSGTLSFSTSAIRTQIHG